MDSVSTLSSTGKVSFDINNSLSLRCLFRVLQHHSCLAKSLVTLSSSMLFLSSPPSFSSQPTLSPTACTVSAFHHFWTVNDNVKGPWRWDTGKGLGESHLTGHCNWTKQHKACVLVLSYIRDKYWCDLVSYRQWGGLGTGQETGLVVSQDLDAAVASSFALVLLYSIWVVRSCSLLTDLNERRPSGQCAGCEPETAVSASSSFSFPLWTDASLSPLFCSAAWPFCTSGTRQWWDRVLCPWAASLQCAVSASPDPICTHRFCFSWCMLPTRSTGPPHSPLHTPWCPPVGQNPRGTFHSSGLCAGKNQLYIWCRSLY